MIHKHDPVRFECGNCGFSETYLADEVPPNCPECGDSR